MSFICNNPRLNVYRLAFGLGDAIVCLAHIKNLSFEWTDNVVFLDYPGQRDMFVDLCSSFKFVHHIRVLEGEWTTQVRNFPFAEVSPTFGDKEVLSVRDFGTFGGLSWALTTPIAKKGEGWLGAEDLSVDSPLGGSYVCIQPSTRDSKGPVADISYCQKIVDRIESTGWPVVLLGSQNDRDQVKIRLKKGLDLRGRLSLGESLATIASSDAVIGCESWTPMAGRVFGKPSFLFNIEYNRSSSVPLDAYEGWLGGVLIPNGLPPKQAMKKIPAKINRGTKGGKAPRLHLFSRRFFGNASNNDLEARRRTPNP